MKKVMSVEILYEKPNTIALVKDGKQFHAGYATLAPNDTYNMKEAAMIALDRALRAKYGTKASDKKDDK